ncbi:hypothetical protein R3P38DRAFT_3494774 [Favolaschia claudopus]|uniref:DUF4410 domain-containing protein n=1 Tax=Favolaschia claudopus TaxID=2862362 RepID=A0AAV9Z666_9AGAR
MEQKVAESTTRGVLWVKMSCAGENGHRSRKREGWWLCLALRSTFVGRCRHRAVMLEGRFWLSLDSIRYKQNRVFPTYAFAATRPVNQPGVEPVITEEQLWKGLEIKARNPSVFVPMITSAKVTKDSGNKARNHVQFCMAKLTLINNRQLTREVTFGTNPQVITEEIEGHAATIVYFEMHTGSRVTNIISYGPDGQLLLTYGFANGIPGIPSDKPKPSAKELNDMIGKAVEHGIDVVRQMVKEGKL